MIQYIFQKVYYLSFSVSIIFFRIQSEFPEIVR